MASLWWDFSHYFLNFPAALRLRFSCLSFFAISFRLRAILRGIRNVLVIVFFIIIFVRIRLLVVLVKACLVELSFPEAAIRIDPKVVLRHRPLERFRQAINSADNP